MDIPNEDKMKDISDAIHKLMEENLQKSWEMYDED